MLKNYLFVLCQRSYSSHINHIFCSYSRNWCIISTGLFLSVYVTLKCFVLCKYSQLPPYRKDLYYSSDKTEFCYNGSNISAMKALRERTQFDVRGHSVITEFDIEGVCCIDKLYHFSSVYSHYRVIEYTGFGCIKCLL